LAVIPSPATQVSSSVEDRAKRTDARPSFKHASSFEHIQQPRPLSKRRCSQAGVPVLQYATDFIAQRRQILESLFECCETFAH
jgi:hypothetical protein